MRIFSESWNDENHAREKKKKVWMEKVTLHTVSEDSDWHFLTATSRQEKKKKQTNLEIPILPKYQMSSRVVA